MNVTRLMLALRRAMSMLLPGSRKPEAGSRKPNLRLTTFGAVVALLLAIASNPALGSAVTPNWFNPLDYGATGDGTHNDAPAIMTAMAHAAGAGATGGTAYIPPGTYRLDGTVKSPTATVNTTSLTTTVTTADATNLVKGQTVTLAGAGASGADLVTSITGVTTTTPPAANITLATAPSTALTACTVTVWLIGVTIRGDGSLASKLVINGSQDGIEINGVYSHVTIQDLSIATYNASRMTSGWAINITGTSTAHSDNISLRHLLIENTYAGVNWLDSDSGTTSDVTIYQTLTNSGAPFMAGQPFFMESCKTQIIHALTAVAFAGYFGNAVVTIDGDTDTITLDNCRATGSLAGDADFLLQNSLGAGHTGPRLIHLSDGYAEGAGAGIGTSTYTGYGDGYYITAGRDVRLERCHAAINAGNGFDIGGTSSSSGLQGLTMVNCDAFENGRHGILVATSSPTNVSLEGCASGNNSFYTTQCSTTNGLTSVSVTNGGAMAMGDTVIVTGAGTGGGDLTTTISTISGTSVTLAASAHATLASTAFTDLASNFDGAQIVSGCQNVRVVNCRFGNYLYASGLQRYGLSIGTGSSTDYIVVIGNDFDTNATAGLSNSSTGSHVQVANNVP